MKSSNKRILVGFAGNPNSGKSTLFNNLTGSRQHVGNYPGITVEKKQGAVKHNGYDITIVDLPGTYSLSAHSEDEIVARNFIITEKPDIIVNVLDASNIERNLYLFTQLAELNVPIIAVMNMSDMVEGKGYSIDYRKLSELIGNPVVESIGNKKIGTDTLLATIIDLYEKRIDIETSRIDYGEEIYREQSELIKLLESNTEITKKYSTQWLSIKLLENDPEALEIVHALPNNTEILHHLEKSQRHLQLHYDDDPEVLIADRRYGFISGVCAQVMHRTALYHHDISDKIDTIMLNRFLGLPIFAIVMYCIFKFTFTFSEPVVGWFETFFEWLAIFISSIVPEGLIQSFLVDGIIGGMGGVFSFFPLVLFMFFAIAFFEDSGYMARAAFVMDKIMHKFGLHGKSFLPMMISTNGCAVPGIMASRTLESKKDRLITMMVTPFMICGAKLPIFALFIAAFFPANQGTNMMFLMYGLSVTIAFGCAWILKKFVFKGETAHFVMELPPYRAVTIQGLLLKMWERGWQYLKKAGSIILLISILIWAGFTFPQVDTPEDMPAETVSAVQMQQSFAGKIGKFIEPAVEPLGLDWRSAVALLAGIAAKEVVVSTLGTIYSLGEIDAAKAGSLKDALQNDPAWNPLKAFAFLMFCLIYIPCITVMAVFYRESGSSWKWTAFLLFSTTALAWVAALAVYQTGMLLGCGA